MKQFLVIYHAPAEAMAEMSTNTEEDNAKVMEEWMAWKAKTGNAVTDFGNPVMGGHATLEGSSWKQSDKEVGGYSLLQGESFEAVQALFTDHPHLSSHPKASLEVHEIIPM